MTRYVLFFVPGEVRGKGRPRFVKATGRTYTDGATSNYENLVKVEASRAMGGTPLFDGPVKVTLHMQFVPPAGWPEWKRAAALRGAILPTIKPDFDNALKIVGDALNGVVWTDDTRVVSGSWVKAYGSRPGMEVMVEAVPALPAQATRKADLERLTPAGEAA